MDQIRGMIRFTMRNKSDNDPSKTWYFANSKWLVSQLADSQLSPKS